STDAYCPVNPMVWRTLRGSRATSKPATVAVPASARNKVARMRTAVVLPAPFGPSIAKTVPSRALRSIPARAWVDPNLLVRAWASIAYVMPAIVVGTAGRVLACAAQVADTGADTGAELDRHTSRRLLLVRR